MAANIRHIISNENGVSVTEFGLIAPVLMIMLLGTYDVGHEMYVKTVLNGALQEVGRNSALEGASNVDQREEIDEKLRASVLDVAPGADVEITRRYYKTFSKAAAAQAEQVIEEEDDANNLCDDGETFMDANHNGEWDQDGGTDGQGGAKDVVIVKVTVRYDRLFPAGKFIGYADNVILVSDSVIANQPYGQQVQFAAPVPVDCPETEV
jgi:Flp pilus assembly pilin Flp